MLLNTAHLVLNVRLLVLVEVDLDEFRAVELHANPLANDLSWVAQVVKDGVVYGGQSAAVGRTTTRVTTRTTTHVMTQMTCHNTKTMTRHNADADCHETTQMTTRHDTRTTKTRHDTKMTTCHNPKMTTSQHSVTIRHHTIRHDTPQCRHVTVQTRQC